MKGSKSEPESNTLSASKGSPSPPSARQSKQARSKIEVLNGKTKSHLDKVLWDAMVPERMGEEARVKTERIVIGLMDVFNDTEKHVWSHRNVVRMTNGIESIHQATNQSIINQSIINQSIINQSIIR